MKKLISVLALLPAIAGATGIPRPVPSPIPNPVLPGNGANFPGSSGGFGGGVGAVPIAPNPSPVPNPGVPLPRPVPVPVPIGVVNNGGQGGSGGVGGQGGQGGAGGNIAPGAVQFRGGSYPVQAPSMAIGTGMSYSQANCANGVGAAGSGQGGGGSFLWPWESDACNARLDSAHFAGLGLHKSACFRFVQMDDNADAMKAAGETCNDVVRTSVAVPMPGAIVPTATPTLDRVMPMENYVPRDEFNKKLDNLHRIEEGK